MGQSFSKHASLLNRVENIVQLPFGKSFRDASESVNFIIRLRPFAGIVPFELTNNWTGERLSLRRYNENNCLLVRCPIQREEDKWTNWEKEAIEWQWRRQWNCISINLKDSDIGDG
ncbi:hypothetical protein GPALN_003270 [Globodera pallida]|nr:hypothetical protein GPALN_003270 [Globodera pallida]